MAGLEHTGEFRYVRVARRIRNAITEGKYEPGERLPPQHQLAKLHGVAFNTLKQSLDLLERDGYIERKIGRGTYVAGPDSRKPSVLVVDDEATIGQLLVKSITALGGRATAVEDGYTALDAFGKDRFDLVFLDLVMPGINGAETFRRLRELDPNVPVVIVTGYPDSDLMNEALDTGPFAMIRKPFTQSDIRSAIRLYSSRPNRGNEWFGDTAPPPNITFY